MSELLGSPHSQVQSHRICVTVLELQIFEAHIDLNNTFKRAKSGLHMMGV